MRCRLEELDLAIKLGQVGHTICANIWLLSDRFLCKQAAE